VVPRLDLIRFCRQQVAGCIARKPRQNGRDHLREPWRVPDSGLLATLADGAATLADWTAVLAEGAAVLADGA
jgi:hypothetical protein